MNNAHDLEISWCLIVSGILKIPLEENDFPSYEKVPNSVVFALLGMLRERKLLKVSLSKWGWRSHFKKGGIYGEYWLPFYEAVLRGWTKDEGMVLAVQSDPIFSKLLASKVTFLEDQILDATSIDISRRTFQARTASVLAKAKPASTIVPPIPHIDVDDDGY